MEIKDKVAVVTGAASGIGRALCQRFAKEGARAIVAADINEAGVAETLAMIKADTDTLGFCLLYTSPSPRD